MNYDQIKEKVFRIIERQYNKIDGQRVIEELFNIDSSNDFKCEYELIVSGELHYVKIWGSFEHWLYSVSKLLECCSSE